MGDGGAVLRRPGSGAADVSFAALPSMSKSDLSAVHSSEPGNVWLVGRGGAVLRWDGTTLWAAGERGALLRAPAP